MHQSIRLFFLGMLVVTLGFMMAPHAGAQNIVADYLDSAGEGFNDPTSRTSDITGDPTTLGQDRRDCFEAALAVWESHLNLSVEIRVEAEFDPLGGNGSGATLGFAGPNETRRDFTGAGKASTWYAIAEANQLFGNDLGVGNADIGSTYNSDVDGPTVLGSTTFYYGIDGVVPGGKIDFFSTALHEVGHGLGFLSLYDVTDGTLAVGLDDIYTSNLEQTSASPPKLSDMTNGQRLTATTSGAVVWTGTNTVADFGGNVPIYSPNPVEVGSSISHWDTSLNPDELMEPSATVPFTDIGLEFFAFQDMEWPLLGLTPTVSFSTASPSVGEGAGMATITVTVTPAPAGAETVQFATSNGTATLAGSDYTANSGTLNFSASVTSDTFDVLINNDSSVESNETVLLTLSSPSAGLTLGLSSATLTIIDNDFPGVSFSSATYSAGEGDGVATITVDIGQTPQVAASVAFATSDGTALAGTDYTATSGTLNWGIGDVASKSFNVPITDDFIGSESPDETVLLTLSSPSGLTIGGTNPATLSIQDNNGAVSFTNESGGGVVLEDGAAILTVTVTGTVGTVAFQWQKDTGSGFTDVANDPPRITGALTDTLVIDPVVQSDSGTYRLQVTDTSKAVFFGPPIVLTVAPPTPLAGLLGLSILAGACAAGGAVALRRRRR